MSILLAFVGFILAMGILVTIHEWGHYIVARLFNVKVTEFSVGFGRSFFSFQRGETRFKLGIIPLGGFVKFLDERDEDCLNSKNEDYSRAFNRQSVFVKIVIVIAGPIVNLVFAWVVFSLIYFSGTTGFKPIFEKVEISSPLAQSISLINQGLDKTLKIVSVDGKKTNTWKEVDQSILQALVHNKEMIPLGVSSVENKGEVSFLSLSLSNIDINNPKQNRIKLLGFIPKLPEIPVVLGDIKENSSASAANFMHGDKIISVDGMTVVSWYDFVELIRASAGKKLLISYSRQNVIALKEVNIQTSDKNNKQIGFFGASVLLDKTIYEAYRIKTNYSFLESLKQGYTHSVDLINMSLTMIKRMIFGEVDASNLSGPISIADYSGQALQIGWGVFFNLLALLSLSLGILNLLPIPILDGGHLMLYFIEMIKGTPLNSKIELVLQQLGMLLIFSLTFFAIFNDVVRISND